MPEIIIFFWNPVKDGLKLEEQWLRDSPTKSYLWGYSYQSFGKRTFFFTGAKLFNKLPLNIGKSGNIQTFAAEQDISFYHNFYIFLLF